jgi:hypothetical protein
MKKILGTKWSVSRFLSFGGRFLSIATALLLLTTVDFAIAVVPEPGGPITVSPILINGSAGNQFDPHVDGDLAAYTEEGDVVQQIRYYRFSTGRDEAISNVLPGGSLANDLLSDVQGGNIVFTRIIGPSGHVMVFNATTASLSEINPDPGAFRLSARVGGQSVVYVDLLLGDNGEIVHYDLATGTTTRLTNDKIVDQMPAISPDGTVVVWEHCDDPVTFLNCDVYQAVRSGATWTTTAVAATPSQEFGPQTDGVLVVYAGNRGAPGDWHIFYRPVAGGAEVQLEMSGVQGHPSIASGVIAFESRADSSSPSDIFLYEIATNRVFQITNTQPSNETLNDITILPSGELRVVWDSDDDPNGQHNIYAATFTLPPPPNPDTIPPTIALTCPVTANLRATAYASVNVSDSESGVGSQSAPNGNSLLDTSTVGPHTFTVTATDIAGNSSSNSCTYGVIYDFQGAGGFGPPIANPPATNTAKGGSTVPVKWQLPDGQGGYISNLGVVTSLNIQEVQCSNLSTTLTNEVAASTSGNSGLRYDAATHQFIYNWNTDRSMAGKCYVFILRLNDGSEYRANFSLR